MGQLERDIGLERFTLKQEKLVLKPIKRTTPGAVVLR
jgi:hypothetical protein